jgi:hypothetical protein
MATAFLSRSPLIVAGRAWAHSFTFTLGKGLAASADPLTGYVAQADFAQANVANPLRFSLSSAAGSIAIAGNRATLTAAAATTAGWAPGDYDFALRVWLPGAPTDRWLVLSSPADSRVSIQKDPTA